MQHYNDKISNVVAVLRFIKTRFHVQASTTDLRKFAVEAVASLEDKKYKNSTSSMKTIHDACARRFRPDIKSMKHFDTLVDNWRNGKGSNPLQAILVKHATQSIRKIF
jgi:hypothetical protein